MVLTEDKKEILMDRFSAIHESENEINDLKEQEKVYSESIKDTFKAIYKDLEIEDKDSDGKKGVKDAYKEYVKELENPSWADSKNTTYDILKESDFLNASKLRD